MSFTVHLVNSLDLPPNKLFAGHFYVLPDGSIYLSQKADELGGLIDTLIRVGQTVVSSIGSSGGGSGTRPAKGLQQITAFGNQVMSALDQALNSINQIPPAQRPQILAEAERVVSLLSNPQAVYQAQRGDDAAALQRFKRDAAQKLAALRAAIGAGGSITQGNSTTTGGGSITPGSSTLDSSVFVPERSQGIEIDTTTILLFGGAAFALVWFMK